MEMECGAFMHRPEAWLNVSRRCIA